MTVVRSCACQKRFDEKATLSQGNRAMPQVFWV